MAAHTPVIMKALPRIAESAVKSILLLGGLVRSCEAPFEIATKMKAGDRMPALNLYQLVILSTDALTKFWRPSVSAS